MRKAHAATKVRERGFLGGAQRFPNAKARGRFDLSDRFDVNDVIKINAVITGSSP
jgi:hypothetical protein